MNAAYATDHARPAIPFIVATAAILLFTTMDAIVKAMPNRVPTIELVAMRFIFGIPLTVWTSRLSAGRQFRRWRLLQTPEENAPPPELLALKSPPAQVIALSPPALPPAPASMVPPPRPVLRKSG